jgi:tetratricopeptide (TPR) repeat protein
MKTVWVKSLTAMFVLSVLTFSVIAADGDDAARSQFEDFYDQRNDSKDKLVKRAIDRVDLTRRVFAVQALDAEVKRAFDDNFWKIVGPAFFDGTGYVDAKYAAQIVDFVFRDGKGRAVVRFRLPRHNYVYQIWDLRHNNRGRLKVVDRFESTDGQLVSVTMSEALSLQAPSRAATRRLLSVSSPSDQQIFQVTELLKAARDQQGPRFFEIYDDLDPRTKKEPLIVKHAMKLAHAVQNADRYRMVLNDYVAVNKNNPNVALLIATSYFTIGDYEKSYMALERFHEHIDMREGAIPARLSALALASGKNEAAVEYAEEATQDEPGLELGWWSLLRARVQLSDFEGALEALTHLEDDFGHTLDAAQLRRDRFRGFIRLSESEVFEKWRETR